MLDSGSRKKAMTWKKNRRACMKSRRGRHSGRKSNDKKYESKAKSSPLPARWAVDLSDFLSSTRSSLYFHMCVRFVLQYKENMDARVPLSFSANVPRLVVSPLEGLEVSHKEPQLLSHHSLQPGS